MCGRKKKKIKRCDFQVLRFQEEMNLYNHAFLSVRGIIQNLFCRTQIERCQFKADERHFLIAPLFLK